MRQARHRVHAAGVVGRRSSASPAARPTGRRCTSAARSASGSPASSPPSGRWRRAGAAAPTGELVDVSMLEALAMCLTYYPVTFNDQLGRPMRKRRFVPTPGVGRGAATGWSGSACGTGQQWLDFCVMVGHPEWTEDRSLFLERTALGADDRRVGRASTRSTRCSTWRRRSASRTRRSSTAPTRRRIEHFRARGTLRRRTRATARPTPGRRSGSRRRRCATRAGAAPRRARRRRRATRAPRRRRGGRCRSAGCGCST